MCDPFAMFPRRLLRAGLSLREQSVLLCLLSYRNGNGQAWPSRSKIAADTGLRISHVHESVRSLAGRGFIRLETQPGVRTLYTFPCLDAQPAETPEPAPAPVVAKNATAAKPAPEQVAAPAPEPVREPVPVAEQVAAPAPKPAPAIAQPTDDNPSQVAKTEELPAKTEELPAKTEELPAKTEELPAPMPEPAPAPAQQPVAKPQPVAAPAQVQPPAPMPALEPAPPAPRRNIVSARVARLPDVDEAVRREVEARPIIRSTAKPIDAADPDLRARALKLQVLCAENTARSREQQRAAQRFEDGVTAATEQVARQVAAQDIAAARQRAAQDAAAAAVKPDKQAEPGTTGDVIPGNGQNVEQQPAPEQLAPATEKTTDGQNADAARDAAVREGCYPAGGKTNAPDAAATAPIVVPAPVTVQESPEPAPQPALPIICEPQQGELLPAPPKKKRGGSKTNGHRIPADWYLTKKLGMWAKEKYGLDDDTIRSETEKFIDHWTASANENAWKFNWDSAWRSWIRKYAESGGTANGNSYNNRPQQKSKMMQTIEFFANKYNGDFEIPF